MRANLLIVTQADMQFIVIESGQQSFFERSTHALGALFSSIPAPTQEHTIVSWQEEELLPPGSALVASTFGLVFAVGLMDK